MFVDVEVGGGLTFIVEVEPDEPPEPPELLPSLTIRTWFTLILVELKQFCSVTGGMSALFSVKMISAHWIWRHVSTGPFFLSMELRIAHAVQRRAVSLRLDDLDGGKVAIVGLDALR